MLSTKFRVNWPFGSGQETQNRFPKQQPWWPSWISDRNELANFDLPAILMLSTKFQVNWPFGSGEEEQNRFQR